MTQHLSESELTAGLTYIRNSPKDFGKLELIVVRPKDREREILEECRLSLKSGAEGDMWAETCGTRLPDGSPDPNVQITLMNSRCIALLAQEKSRWLLAGDQLYVDLDLSEANLPVRQKLTVGTAVLEITSIPHTGCGLFSERFGPAAAQFVNSPVGKELHLRGIYARVIQDGVVKTGDRIRKIG